jgi:hypothetical protein
MQTITVKVPDSQFSNIMNELKKFKDIKIELNSLDTTKEEIKAGIRQAVSEMNLIKQGKSKARPARELLNEL